jgi:hypothetical protein
VGVVDEQVGPVGQSQGVGMELPVAVGPRHPDQREVVDLLDEPGDPLAE